jgi:DNA gyrase subunit B
MNYEAKDIVSLSQGKAFRTKLGMYLSGDKQEAINLGLRELIVNVQDEYQIFKPKNPLLKIILNTTSHEITVIDNMRGIPVGIRDDGINSLTAACLMSHSGGKHQEGVYANASGINGEGIKIVCHTAKTFNISVKREHNIYTQSFESDDEGAHPTTEVLSQPYSGTDTGTSITYIPDERVYGNIFIDIEKLKALLTEISYFTLGLKIELTIDNDKTIFLSKNGLIDGLQSANRLSTPFNFFYEEDKCKVELALQFVTKHGCVKGYANGLYMTDGGAFVTSFRRSLTRTFNTLANRNYSGEQIRDILDGYLSVKVPIGQFSNQAKTALANPEAATAASPAITLALKDFAANHKDEFDKIVTLLDKISKADEAADKVRQSVLENKATLTKELKQKVILAGVLTDCRRHDEKSTLFLAEGKSAAGTIINARDSDYVAVLGLRGKPLNVLKSTDEQIYKNQELQELMIALGFMPDNFNLKKLRYGKIAICADADYDGFAITCLLLAFFYKMYPELLRQGKIYYAKTALYKIVTKKNEHFYAYSDEELSKLPKGEVTRFKGIGESSAEDFQKTILSENGHFIQMTMNDAENAAYYFNSLLGTDLQERKDIIADRIDFSVREE